MCNIKKVVVIGLGSMEYNIAKNIHEKWKGELYGFDINVEAIKKANEMGIKASDDMNAFDEKFDLIKV